VIVFDGIFGAVNDLHITRDNVSNIRLANGSKILTPDTTINVDVMTTLHLSELASFNTVHISFGNELYLFDDAAVTGYNREIGSIWNKLRFSASSVEQRKL